jgi:hypothetical protein
MKTRPPLDVLRAIMRRGPGAPTDATLPRAPEAGAGESLPVLSPPRTSAAVSDSPGARYRVLDDKAELVGDYSALDAAKGAALNFDTRAENWERRGACWHSKRGGMRIEMNLKAQVEQDGAEKFASFVQETREAQHFEHAAHAAEAAVAAVRPFVERANVLLASSKPHDQRQAKRVMADAFNLLQNADDAATLWRSGLDHFEERFRMSIYREEAARIALHFRQATAPLMRLRALASRTFMGEPSDVREALQPINEKLAIAVRVEDLEALARYHAGEDPYAAARAAPPPPAPERQLSPRARKIAEGKRRKARLAELEASNNARIGAINEKLDRGAIVRVETAHGPREIVHVGYDFVARTFPPGMRGSFDVMSLHYHAGYLDEWERQLGLKPTAGSSS